MKTDIAYVGQLKATSYRFSIAWSRIFPNCSGEPNEAGIKFYSDMVDEIIKNGAEPIATMWHWDEPQACFDAYQGWMSEKMATDFAYYAEFLMKRLGDRVTYWLTMNEPYNACERGYKASMYPPALNGGLAAEMACIHHINLAHGMAVQKGRAINKGFKFGMPLPLTWGEPADANNPDDVTAAEVSVLYMANMHWGPLTTGDYAANVKNDPIAGKVVLTYTPEQQAIMKNTIDFVGINYYSGQYVISDPTSMGGFKGLSHDVKPIGDVSGTPWQQVYPEGLRKGINLVAKQYNLDVYVTECGVSVAGEPSMATAKQVADDQFRIDFFNSHTQQLVLAMQEDKIPVKMFLAWSLFDNFEWMSGYSERFGVVAIDFDGKTTGTALTRTVKKSATFLSDFFQNSHSPLQSASTKTGSGTGAGHGTNSHPNGSGILQISALGILTAALCTVMMTRSFSLL